MNWMIKNYEIMIKWTDNDIGAEGAIKICELLMMNTTLNTLDLGSLIEEETKL